MSEMKRFKSDKVFKATISIVSVIGYALFFLLVNKFVRGQTAIFAIFPVIIFGLLYGLWGGIIAGVMSFPANVLLYYLAGDETFLNLLNNYFVFGKVIGQFGQIVIGGVVGQYNRKLIGCHHCG